MYMKNIFILILILLNCKINSYSQLHIDIEIRPRFEIRDGYQKLQYKDASPTFLTTQRSRLTFNYQTENLRIKLAPQDVRLWGDEELANMTAVYGDYASLDMFEGYFEAKVKNNTWVSVGRQQLVYDNEWLLAARNWNQHGNSIDAFVVKSKPLGADLHAGIAWNTYTESLSNNFFPSDRIKSINYVWLNKNISNNFKMSIIYLATGVTKNDTSNVLYYRHTSGVFAEHKSDKFFASFNGYHQSGVNKTGKNVNAFLGFVDLRYIANKFFTGSSVSYLSGNKNTGENMRTDNLFDNIYGARHRYFGFMDYFRNFSTHTAQGGLVDYALTFHYNISKQFSMRNIVHYFQLAKTNISTGINKNLGFENDFVIKYTLNNVSELEIGYCFFLPTETLKSIQNIENKSFSQFAYVQFTVKSRVLN